MDRLFFEVFPTLKINKALHSEFEGMTVSEVHLSADGHVLKVRLNSDAMPKHSHVLEVEQAVSSQLFEEKRQVRFEIFAVHDRVRDLDGFPDSLRDEVIALVHERSGRLDREILKLAQWDCVSVNTIELKIPESRLLLNRRDAICQELAVIFKEHFGLSPQIRITAVERDERSERALPPVEPVIRQPAPAPEPAPVSAPEEAPKKRSRSGMIYGRSFKQETVPISSLHEGEDLQAFDCQVFDLDVREIKNEKTVLSFSGTDYTDSIKTKIFVPNQKLDEILSKIRVDAFLTVCGRVEYDSFEKDTMVSHVFGIRQADDFRERRHDDAPQKRIELHCHTRMSDMDAVSSPKSLLARAHDWGHEALAITDHGVLQAFPDIHAYKNSLPKDDPFKPIYGVEGYLVDDLRSVSRGGGENPLNGTFVALDFETTGFSRIGDRIIEIGAVRIVNGKCSEEFSSYVNPGREVPYRITELTGITAEDLKSAPSIEEVLPEFLKFIGESMLIAHNAGFDVGFLEQACRRCGIERSFAYLDTVELARLFLPELTRFRLDTVAKALKLPPFAHHRATDDARVCGEIFGALLDKMKAQGMRTVSDLDLYIRKNGINPKNLPTFHVILLARNDIGRVNLYTLTSKAHLEYYGGGKKIGKPRIPKSELNRYRDGLIVGSACSSGELYRAITEDLSEEEIEKIATWYDYLEIQPVGNNAYLIDDERSADIRSFDDLRDVNKRIVALGEKLHKPVCATGDVHFLDPEDEVFRRIIQVGNGMADGENQPPLYLHTTQEMLDEFSYLGEEKAHEVVIDMPQLIARSIELIAPVRPDKCPPVIENSDKTLTDICFTRAHEIYGDPLPKIVQERLDRELNSIISNGYAVMYIIAQKLVAKSNEDGYLVGSRGSVGSSFVATMAGITEVNPLSAHYYCPKCHYSEFESERIKEADVDCGWDLPDAVCPKCGTPLKKDGYDIPFETFLGFKGDKEPDIDLNFSGEYQAKAHAYTKVIFGHEQTFKAGTIATVADKTAYGYVKHYFENKGIAKRNCEIERLLAGCTGIRRSTGQHPGGIVVLPLGENINTFTPVQHPANDMTTDIVTTHFDYHSIDHNLLKLDILGHDDPTMIRMLQDLTGLDPTEIPLDDPDVMKLFSSTESLGITTEQNGGIDVGSLGIPEFGTKFVIGMLDDTRPTTMSELVRISGLSHGTDVWLGNAQTLIQEGKAVLSTAICTRDDIMSYLIAQGMDKSLSFKTMESVRKGKGLTPEMKEAMRAANVPEWYIDSCLKIKYMFPRAHAAAYVMMALRIAYCKVHYPLAYYAAYYSIRASAFSYEIMCRGRDHLLAVMEDYQRRKDTLTPKEQTTLDDCLVVREMYARGFEFVPIDIYSAQSRLCSIVDGKIMPSLKSIDGMGEKAADAVVEARKDGPFISRDDFWNRTKVPKTVIEKMHELGLLGDLPESNQISLFDMFE